MDNSPNDGPAGTLQQQIVEKLKGSNNILVTVSSNPSVDQLAAAIGLTILLNKMKKHATAVFSGQVPSTIEFLKPEETIEKNTDSLRDFIIALDKSKADKLRYKVEENVVKIFITPYKTSINEEDLEFSQGDFNVDVVLALGVHEQKDLDQAITSHGRILHDATVISVNTASGSELGAINWVDPSASSLSELAVEISDGLGRDLIDTQIATALLTGIVAETNRFSNEKTSPNTMKLSAELMTAGANQQLVASELQPNALTVEKDTPPAPQGQPPAAAGHDNGTLEIAHAPLDERPPAEPPQEKADDGGDSVPQDDDNAKPPADSPKDSKSQTKTDTKPKPGKDTGPDESSARGLVTDSPSLAGGLFTANVVPEDADRSSDVLSASPDKSSMPLLGRSDNAGSAKSESPKDEPPAEPDLPLPAPVGLGESSESADKSAPAPHDAQIHIDDSGNLHTPGTPSLAGSAQSDSGQSVITDTLTDIEESVHSPHLGTADPGSGDGPKPDVDTARNAVMDAINSAPVDSTPLSPKQDLGASGYLNVQDMPTDAGPSPSGQPPAGSASEPPPLATSPSDTPLDMPLPPNLNVPPAHPVQPNFTANDPTAPPPVPPPMTELPPFGP